MTPGRIWIALTLLLSSAGSMALEIVAGRLLAPYVGMSLYSWTAIIAVVLAGLSAGHWVGGWLADRPGRLASVAGGALLAASGTALASLFVLRAAAGPVLGTFDPLSAVGLLAMAAFFLPSLAVGVVSPVLTRMALDAAPEPRRGRVLGTMFALGALGAILGTVAAGFWLIGQIGAHASVLAVALCYAVLAVPFLRGTARVGCLAAAAVVIGAAVGEGRVAALTSPCDRESDYYCVRIAEAPGMGPRGRIMVLDHLAHGINLRDHPELLHSPYVQLVDELTALRFTQGPGAAFFVGGGAYTLPRAWAARWPDAALTVAEIDPEVTRAASEEMWLDPSRMRILHRDARVALAAEPEGAFDVIFGDAFHDIAIPAHLVSDEFHALVASRLTPGGIYALNVVEALREPPFLLALVGTLRNRFAAVELWLHEESLGSGEARAVWIVLASDRDSGLAELTARSGLARRWVRIPTGPMLAVMPEAAAVFLTDDHAPVDRLMRHILLDPRLAE